jgi:putative transferase (TIGR04331 family)
MTSPVATEQGRCLITTADEQSWRFDRPLLFLGEWCRRHARRHIWQPLDAVVAAPYGLASEARDRDHARARAYEAALFPHLCAALNRHHATVHGERYWRILLGHWFRRYVEVLLNRHQTLEGCLHAYRPTVMTVFADDAYMLAPHDSYAAIRAFDDAHWNARLYAKLIGYMNAGDVDLEALPSTPQRTFGGFLPPVVPRSVLQRMLAWALRQARTAASHFSRTGDALIVNSFLPRLEEVRLQLALRQFPQQLAGRTRSLPAMAIDPALRRRLTDELVAAAADGQVSGLEQALPALLFDLLPACYLEGYVALTAAADALPWPQAPRFIFTSNNFDTDELFKAWTAGKVATGVPYIAGQHGSNYGTSRYMNPSVEEITADRFITWGWTDGLPQQVPGFIFKTGNAPQQPCDPHGGLLLIELHAGQMLTTWDAVAEFAEYFTEQLDFVGMLSPSVRQQLTVRLHHEYRNLGWDEVARWQAFDPSIRLETGEQRLVKLIAASRLVVHSYDSTGILETLAQNIPTLAFWQNGFAHLRDSAKPYYRGLVEAGIVHLSPQSAAAHIDAIWADVGAWWASAAVQAARLHFCAHYARVSNAPAYELKQILLDSAATIEREKK